jgi:beta-lactamase regulating signal transducer with metallopeptidase domain
MIDLIFLKRVVAGIGISVLIFVIMEFMIQLMHIQNNNQRFHLYVIVLLSSFSSILYSPFLLNIQAHGNHVALFLPNVSRELEAILEGGLVNVRRGFVFINFRLIFLILMVVSLLFFVSTLVLSRFYVKRRLRADQCIDQKTIAVLERVCSDMKMKVPEVVMVDGLNAFVFGIPAVLAVGKELVRNCNEKELRLVFRHEMNHIRNRDNILKPILFSLRIFFFFNPVIHVVSQKIATEREFLADNISKTRKDKILFLYTLARLRELHIEKKRLLFSITSSPLLKPNLTLRTETLLSEPTSIKWHTYCVSLWVFTLLLVAGSYVSSPMLRAGNIPFSDGMALFKVGIIEPPAEFMENKYRDHGTVLACAIGIEPVRCRIGGRPERVDNPPRVFPERMNGGLYDIDVRILIAAIIVVSLTGGMIRHHRPF